MIHKLNINNTEKYDVVVCGGGMTGFAAAVSSARSGKKTLLIEKNGCMGGVGTAGSVTCLLGGIDYEDGKYKFVSGGLFKELYYNLRKRNECVDIYKVNRNRSPHAWYAGLAESIIYDNEAMKRELDSIAIKAGVGLLYYSVIFDLKKIDEKIEYVLITGKSGITAVYGDVFIDCTGDADIAYLAGCKCINGREEDNLMAPATLIMNLDNVNTEELLQYIEKNHTPRFKELIKGLKNSGEWPFPFEIMISMLLNRPGNHMANSIRQVGIDGTDSRSLTEGMIEGRKENKELFDILVKHFPGYKDAVIQNTAEDIGIRETRRIVGEFILKLEDLLKGAVNDDIIALAAYSFDLPDPKKPSYQPLEGKEIKRKYTEIPYRCLLPGGIENLLVAGRSISVEREVLGPIRVMGPCIGMGQAAGFAAAMASDENISVKSIDTDKLKINLENADCITEESQACTVMEDL